jgi:hypothetical protein
MRYKVQFCKQWVGTWVFDAANDFRAWKTAYDYIQKHTSVVTVDITAIYELDVSDNIIRKIPDYKDCENILKRQQNKKSVKKEEKAIYKAYFSDGECSGPYIAIVSENDNAALESAQHKLTQHIERNGLDIAEITVTQIEELNENQFFTINLNRKEEKKNRYLLGNKEC